MNTLDTLCEIAREIFLADFADNEPQQFTIPINPVPASRPRVYQNGVGYGKKYTEFMEKSVGPCNSFCGDKTSKPVAAFIEHVVARPKKPKKPYPNGDIDNYDKGPMDAMVKSKLFFEDDVQVVFLISVKRYQKENEEVGVHTIWFAFDM